MRKREDDAAIEREIVREHETREEQRRGDVTGFESDERAAETVTFHADTIEDAERLADGDDE
jgi:hypothetical protein